MMQVIDEAYIQAIMDLPDGAARMLRWITQMIEECDEAAAVVRDQRAGGSASASGWDAGGSSTPAVVTPAMASVGMHVLSEIDDDAGWTALARAAADIYRAMEKVRLSEQ